MKDKEFTKRYKYIHKQLDKQGKIYLNSFVDFIDNLVNILEEQGIDEKKYKEILTEKIKKS